MAGRKKQKLELVWPGKEDRPRLEPRILIEDPEKSYHASARRSEDDQFDNMLIKGDNLLALKALEAEYAGKVKCVFIDPPYNTGSAFEHYDDGLEHSIWLSMMRDRLELIHRLLSEDGSLWVTLDDNEAHYFRVMCDEVFGRRNFISNAVWQKKYSPQNDAKWLSDNHDHILIYAKDKNIWRPNLLPRSAAMDERYKNLDNDPRGPWKPADFSVKTYSATNDYPITTPSGRVVEPAKSRSWVTSEQRLKELINDNRIWFGSTGNNVPALKKFLTEVKSGSTSMTIWLYEEVGHNQDAKKEIKEFNNEVVFDTPKPEKLLQRILHMATKPGDFVLDSFAGSGTTGAVAQKMGCKWIMVEIGDHADTHIVPRLQKVIDGEDQGGISKAVEWKGGGGFRYYTLAPSLLEEDKYGNWVISKDYNPPMLAEAMCKHMGFVYEPSQEADEYWRHGASTESDFIYVTTQSLTHEACRKISEDVGPDRSLLICCKAYSANAESFENLTLVKIPTAILSKCEWGRDDYSLNIANLPFAEDEEDEAEVEGPEGLPLFGGEGDSNA